MGICRADKHKHFHNQSSRICSVQPWAQGREPAQNMTQHDIDGYIAIKHTLACPSSVHKGLGCIWMFCVLFG